MNENFSYQWKCWIRFKTPNECTNRYANKTNVFCASCMNHLCFVWSLGSLDKMHFIYSFVILVCQFENFLSKGFTAMYLLPHVIPFYSLSNVLYSIHRNTILSEVNRGILPLLYNKWCVAFPGPCFIRTIHMQHTATQWMTNIFLRIHLAQLVAFDFNFDNARKHFCNNQRANIVLNDKTRAKTIEKHN